MQGYRFLSLGLLVVAGCSTASPFATSARQPVPLGEQMVANPGGPGMGAMPTQQSPQAGMPGGSYGQQLTQSGPNTYAQQPADADTSMFAGFRATTAKIGQALAIQPKVIPATDPTSLANQPKNIGADLHFQAAQVYEGQQNFPGAILHFQKALEKSPGDPVILVAFGRLYDRQGDFPSATRLYQQALQSDANNCAALNALGICYAKQGNLDVALAHLGRAAQLQPQNVRYKNNLANVLADAGRVDEALAQLVSVHGEAGAHYNLGYLLLQQGKRHEARRELALALQANPYLEDARKMLAEIEPPPGPAALPQLSAAPPNPAAGRFLISQPIDPRETRPAPPQAGAPPFNAPPAARTRSLPPL